jgi:hypothetical protein
VRTVLFVNEITEFSYSCYKGIRYWRVLVTNVNNSMADITNTAWVRARLCELQKRCTRLAAASDKVYQLLAHGQRFSPDTPNLVRTVLFVNEITEFSYSCYKGIRYWRVLVTNVNNSMADDAGVSGENRW